jgi:hypothetical protein
MSVFKRVSIVFGLVVLLILSLTECNQSTHPTSNTTKPPVPKGKTWSFETMQTGKPPSGFQATLTGSGGPVKWQVVEVSDAPSGKKVVSQLSADETNSRYPVLILNDLSVRNVDISVQFKTLSGEVDASAGIIFRCKDKNNYYVVRANALEDNIVAYKTVEGRRSNIGVKGQGNSYGVEAKVPHLKWNNLRVIVKANLFEIFLNGRKLFEVENDLFNEPGKVGLWTKADAVTQFDDLKVKSLDKTIKLR